MIARALLLLLLLFGLAPVIASAAIDPARYMDAKLVAETASPKPGTTILVGLSFTPKPGWHGYWSNPGDSGIAPTVHWMAPKGVSFGPLLHPAPTLLTAADISSFVHEGPHVLLSRMRVDRSIAPGTMLPVKAELSWAACTATQCVPLRATLTLDLVAGDGRPGPQAPLLHAAARKLPKTADASTFTVDGKRIRLTLPASLRLDPGKSRFFPDEGGILDAATEKKDGPLTIGAVLEGSAPNAIAGVLSDGTKAYRLTFNRASADAAPDQSPLAAPAEAPVPTAPPQAAPTRPAETTSAPSLPLDPDRATSWLWLALAAIGALIASLAYARRRRR